MRRAPALSALLLLLVLAVAPSAASPAPPRLAPRASNAFCDGTGSSRDRLCRSNAAYGEACDYSTGKAVDGTSSTGICIWGCCNPAQFQLDYCRDVYARACTAGTGKLAVVGSSGTLPRCNPSTGAVSTSGTSTCRGQSDWFGKAMVWKGMTAGCCKVPGQA